MFLKSAENDLDLKDVQEVQVYNCKSKMWKTIKVGKKYVIYLYQYTA